MPWRPSEPGERPTLGWYVLDWITAMLAPPDPVADGPFRLYVEQEDFVLRWYELHPITGKRLRQRGVISRPRGWGKSPLLGCLAIVEALADVVPDGWDADGQPVGKPWSAVRTPLVQVAAVSEAQTKNTWDPILAMLQGPVLDAYPGLEPLGTFVNLPRSGRIEPVTSSARTVKGNRTTFAVLDQTEEWVKGNGGKNLADNIRNNAAKTGGYTIESPNAFTPGDESVAEDTAAWAALIREGKARDDGLLYDHREAPPETELTDRESLIHGLRVAYGDSSGHPDGCLLHTPPCPPGHEDLEKVVSRVWHPDLSAQKARADYLNQITHASDSYLTQPEWAAQAKPELALRPTQKITLGFDGSRGRAKGKPDATALIACRVTDGHLVTLGVWEAPDGPRQSDWTPPLPEIEAAVAEAFRKYRVVGFYADPAKDWRSHVNAWEARYGSKVKVKVSAAHPFEWWMTGGRSHLNQRAIEAFESAVRNGDLTHDASWALTRHALNARRRYRSGKLTLAKEHDYSANKIDALVAAVLAWQARLDAVSKGLATRKAIVRTR